MPCILQEIFISNRISSLPLPPPSDPISLKVNAHLLANAYWQQTAAQANMIWVYAYNLVNHLFIYKAKLQMEYLMKARKVVSLATLSVLLLVPSAISQEYGPAYMAYGVCEKTCGDFIGESDTQWNNNYVFFTCGSITGLNQNLPQGGNVLGCSDPNLGEFIHRVEDYCRENPMDLFQTGIGKSLNKIIPCNENGAPCTKSK